MGSRHDPSEQDADRAADAILRGARPTVAPITAPVRVALHERQRPGGHSIVSDHLPSQRSDHRHRSRSYWEDRAASLGDEVLAFVREVFDSDDVLHQLRKVQAIVRHVETFPPERARAPCRRASFYGSLDYVAIKSILAKALDLEPLPAAIVPTGEGLERPRFARTIQELLHFTPEDPDASH